MRNKLLCLLSILMIFPSAVLADDISDVSDWSQLSNVENAWDGQKAITNKEYEQVVTELEKRKNAKKIKADKKAGNMIMKQEGGSESDYLSNFIEQYPLLNLTVPIKSAAGIIPIGHYKVVGIKKNGRIYLNLCQSYDIVGKIPAIETDDDFNENDINFVKVTQEAEGILKIMYGSMKFNAYAYMRY